MPAKGKLKVVLCWHMHQPEYRDPANGTYRLPWTYLHAIKDYVDMAAHLEAIPAAKAVVNFVPILLDQITDYAEQVSAYLTRGEPIRDPLLAALAAPQLPTIPLERLELIEACRRVNVERVVNRYTDFKRVADLAGWLDQHPASVCYLSDNYLADLLTWYHLGWLGETVHREDTRVRHLVAKGSGFTLDDRRVLLGVIGELLGGLLDRYQVLVQRKQVELSLTPYAHPILPLLLDLHAAREALPEVLLPKLAIYPDGEVRARYHLREGIETFKRHFGFVPAGCWPAEGGVSTAAADLIGEFGFKWIATGEGVLHNSLGDELVKKADGKEDWLYRPYTVGSSGVRCFFRDDGLSDLIGFTYATWHGDDAVANLVHHLEDIAGACADPAANVVSIILDGENAWEHYPENGYYFLSALYHKLTEHPGLELTTFSDCLAEGVKASALAHMVAGSWVYGNFATWIGDPDKNRGWEMLGDAKDAFDAAMASGRLTPEQQEQAQKQLAICEGSDWFWWFGDYNPENTVADFESLFRAQLDALYKLIDTPAPAYLSRVFTRGAGAPVHGGTMRPGQATA